MNGFCGDSAYTFCVGEVEDVYKRQLETKWITGRQIEAARIAVTRYMQRQGQIWILSLIHIFNKMDRSGADFFEVVRQMKDVLGANP